MYRPFWLQCPFALCLAALPRHVRDENSFVFFFFCLFTKTLVPSHVKLGMPALSPTMTSGKPLIQTIILICPDNKGKELNNNIYKGNLVKWNKKIGDKIKAGDSIADIETGIISSFLLFLPLSLLIIA